MVGMEKEPGVERRAAWIVWVFEKSVNQGIVEVICLESVFAPGTGISVRPIQEFLVNGRHDVHRRRLFRSAETAFLNF